ncbi:hypothetical protein [Streptomyces sp. NBC_00385]|uniref:hypothetical protein n=1 Tax=Streptomyces sp. NBC_00385 TaxID=2975733 RepID=UPI002DDA545F|nr:hypothetical protein [Streptomyces sp. NBC_00385]WRZ02367.1 hypothetical protein OG959_02930 [Streptomyces sp. NBC_00385]
MTVRPEIAFELEPYSTKEEEGRAGTAGAFGEIAVASPRGKWRDKPVDNSTEIRVRGEKLPEVLYRAVGRPRPGLKDARLLIDGVPVELAFNERAFRNSARALQLTFQGRAYAYTVTGAEKGSVLRRTGMEISIIRGEGRGRKGRSSVGTIAGEADGIDLALAVIFEEVDTFALTSGGAAIAAFNWVVTPRTTDSSVGTE